MKKAIKNLTVEEAIERLELFELIMKDPQELGFVLQAKDYAEYLSTYTEIGLSAKQAVYTERQFNKLKEYYKI